MPNRYYKIWKNRKQIFEGIKNAVIYDEYVESVAKDRMSICNRCNYKGKKCAVPRTAPCCNQCGCSLKLKTRSLSSSCPEKKWLAVLSEEQEDKLDEKFNNEQSWK